MKTRREVVLGGALTILLGSGMCRSAASSKRAGCIIPAEHATNLLGSTTGEQLFVTGKEPFLRSSGDRDFDYALAQTLAMISETLAVLPGFAFSDDADTWNASATSARSLSRSDGTVLFGLALLHSLLEQREYPDVAVAAVCAHEFGHILQFKHDLIRTLQGWDTTVRRVELHADFLAGYFAGIRKARRPTFPAVVFATTAHRFGSFDGNGANFHGTPEERAAAAVQGFQAAFRDRHSLTEAIAISVKYARSV